MRNFFGKTLNLFEILLLIALVTLGAICTQILLEGRPSERKFNKSILEAETLYPKTSSNHIKQIKQRTDRFSSGSWSQEEQLFYAGVKEGDSVSFTIPGPSQQDQILYGNFTTASDYGVLEMSIDSKPVKTVDFFSRFINSKRVEIYRANEMKQAVILTLRVTGHHPDAREPYYQLGVDGFWWEDGEAALRK